MGEQLVLGAVTQFVFRVEAETPYAVLLKPITDDEEKALNEPAFWGDKRQFARAYEPNTGEGR